MKKNMMNAVMNFFGTAALIGFLDLCVARFDTAAFAQRFTSPSHLAFVAVFSLILGAAAFVRRPRAGAASAAAVA